MREPPVDPLWEALRRYETRRRRHFDVKNLRLDTGFRLICTSKWLIPGREPPPRLHYDPQKLDPHAPRLRISKNGGDWEVHDGDGALLSIHAVLPDALDAAMERAEACFSEILVLGSDRRMKWSVTQNPEYVELARFFNQHPPIRR